MDSKTPEDAQDTDEADAKQPDPLELLRALIKGTVKRTRLRGDQH